VLLPTTIGWERSGCLGRGGKKRLRPLVPRETTRPICLTAPHRPMPESGGVRRIAIRESHFAALGNRPRARESRPQRRVVLDAGTGEPALLFLHYYGGSARTWSGVTSRLSQYYRCVAYDQRGWGLSDAPPDGYAIADLARDASEVIRALQIARYVLVGHSMRQGRTAPCITTAGGPRGRSARCTRRSDTSKHSRTGKAATASRLRQP
jgi:hypothetical protein